MKHNERGDFSPNPELIKLLTIGIVIGAISSGIAFLLVNLIRGFTNLFFFGEISLLERAPSEHQLGLGVILIPVVGSLIVGLMARFGSEKIQGHGIPEALEAILFGKSLMKPKIAILKPLSSAISIGSGGPFGAEGPIIMTGGAFGSIFAQLFQLTSVERKTLLVAGAAAGMSAVFATPISAVLLSVELLLFEWKPRSLVPVALASLTAAGLRPYLLGTGPLFPLATNVQPQVLVLVFAVLVGVIAGGFSSVTSAALYKLEDAFAKLPIHWMWWPALGGLVVGLGGYFKPRVLGVGYDVIGDLLQNRIALGAVIALVGTKAIIWVFALASGTSGGVLAPLLMMGAALGVVEGHFLPVGNPSLWALVSMAAVLSGMMRSPFTACLFALELTQDVSALPPILAASISAYTFTVLYMKRSILTEKVARRGYDIFREYGVDPLERVRIEECMSRQVVSISEELTISEVIAKYFSSKARHRGYPVVNALGKAVGIVTSSDLLHHVNEHGSTPIKDLISLERLVFAYPKESCRLAAERMAKHGIGRLLVVSQEDSSLLLGIITRSDLLKARARALDEETSRERFLGFSFKTKVG